MDYTGYLKGFVLALSLACLPLAAAPYVPVDTDAVVVPATAGRAARIDVDALAEAVRALAPRASSLPLKFDSVGDRQAAASVARQLSDALHAANTQLSGDAELLRLVGQWNTLAWRLGDEAAAERAFVHLQAALAVAPDDMQAHYVLGGFLTEFEGGDDLALPHLERAHEAGMPEATYSLAMVYIQKREISRAKALLETCAVRTGSTTDPRFARLLSVLSKNNIHVNGQSRPPLPAAAKRT
jgi:hypothetical protein